MIQSKGELHRKNVFSGLNDIQRCKGRQIQAGPRIYNFVNQIQIKPQVKLETNTELWPNKLPIIKGNTNRAICNARPFMKNARYKIRNSVLVRIFSEKSVKFAICPRQPHGTTTMTSAGHHPFILSSMLIPSPTAYDLKAVRYALCRSIR